MQSGILNKVGNKDVEVCGSEFIEESEEQARVVRLEGILLGFVLLCRGDVLEPSWLPSGFIINLERQKLRGFLFSRRGSGGSLSSFSFREFLPFLLVASNNVWAWRIFGLHLSSWRALKV